MAPSWPPLAVSDLRTVVLATRSRTNTSPRLFVSPLTRLEAVEWKPTRVPSVESDASLLLLVAWTPAVLTETRIVWLVAMSRTKTSSLAFLSPITRLVATDYQTTREPSPEIAGSVLRPVAWTPAPETDTRMVVVVWRSWRKMSVSALVSPNMVEVGVGRADEAQAGLPEGVDDRGCGMACVGDASTGAMPPNVRRIKSRPGAYSNGRARCDTSE